MGRWAVVTRSGGEAIRCVGVGVGAVGDVLWALTRRARVLVGSDQE